MDFKVTVEFTCNSMIDEQTLNDKYNGDAKKAYLFISDEGRDSVVNFCDGSEVITNVSVIK